MKEMITVFTETRHGDKPRPSPSVSTLMAWTRWMVERVLGDAKNSFAFGVNAPLGRNVASLESPLGDNKAPGSHSESAMWELTFLPKHLLIRGQDSCFPNPGLISNRHLAVADIRVIVTFFRTLIMEVNEHRNATQLISIVGVISSHGTENRQRGLFQPKKWRWRESAKKKSVVQTATRGWFNPQSPPG